MCGIAGIFHYGGGGEPVNDAELSAIRDHMTRRGPDGAGSWLSEDRVIGLAHRRLSIIDLSDTGAQPMSTPDGRLTIVFNGEIYNYRDLRTALEGRGFRFVSSSDTEVLLHLFAEKGEAMVNELRGMYAFAIWDRQAQTLFLARDPLGIKPLYYHDDGHTLRFASQVKALLAGGKLDLRAEPAGQVGFFLWGHVPEPFTLYKGIRALPAGSSMLVRRTSSPRISSFCSIRELFVSVESRHSHSKPDNDETSERLRRAVHDSVARHLIADVPVGVFLSSGIDSATIATIASSLGGSDLRTITLGFEEYRGTGDDETVLAETISRQCGTRHETRWMARSEFQAHLPQLLSSMDQPTIDGVNAYFVSKVAAEAGLKAAVSGLGGDEIFGGYPSFRQIPMLVNTLGRASDSFGKWFRLVSGPVLKHFTSPKYAGLFEYSRSYGRAYLLRRALFMPWELPEIMDPDLAAAGWEELQTISALESTAKDIVSPRLQVSLLELSWYMRNQLLRDCDWASMAHSLEVRVPLVDIELIRAIAPLLATDKPPGKLELAATARPRLPAEVLSRGKTGFSIPVRTWLMGCGEMDGRGLRGWAMFVAEKFKLTAPAASRAAVTD